jgi:hypothetical protein
VLRSRWRLLMSRTAIRRLQQAKAHNRHHQATAKAAVAVHRANPTAAHAAKSCNHGNKSHGHGHSPCNVSQPNCMFHGTGSKAIQQQAVHGDRVQASCYLGSTRHTQIPVLIAHSCHHECKPRFQKWHQVQKTSQSTKESTHSVECCLLVHESVVLNNRPTASQHHDSSCQP